MIQNQPATVPTPATTITATATSPQHPGIYLQALLKDQQMSAKMLALRTGTSSAHISNVLSGKKPVSIELARNIEFVLGIDFKELLTRQSHYEKSCLDQSEEQEITAEEITLAASLEKEAAIINSGKALNPELNHPQRVIALRKLLKIDNLLRVPAVLQALIDPPPDILEQKPYQALDLLNQYDATAAGCKKRDDFKAVPLNQNRLKDTLPILSAMRQEGKIINLAQEALEQCGIVIKLVTGSKDSLFYSYVKKVEPGTLLLFITERCSSNKERWTLLADLLEKVTRGEIKNRLVYFQPPAPQAPPPQPGSKEG